MKNNTKVMSSLSDLEKKLDEVFEKKAPQLPESIKELMVKYGPYLSLIMIVLSLPLLLSAFGLSALVAPMAFLGGVRAGVGFSMGILVTLVVVAMQGMAIPGLFKRQISAWKLLFWASLVSAVGSLLRFDLGGLIIGSVISWYFLFQIRSFYK